MWFARRPIDPVLRELKWSDRLHRLGWVAVGVPLAAVAVFIPAPLVLGMLVWVAWEVARQPTTIGLLPRSRKTIVIVCSGDRLTVRTSRHAGEVHASEIESGRLYEYDTWESPRIEHAISVRLRGGGELMFPDHVEGFDALREFIRHHQIPLAQLDLN